MGIRVSDLVHHLDDFFPKSYAEDFDNTGLLVGDADALVRGVLVALDFTEDVLEEALARGCNVIYAFHPIIFKGIKSVTSQGNYAERLVFRAIKNDLAIYAGHTRIDNHPLGLHRGMADLLNLSGGGVLIPRDACLKKLTTYVPQGDATSLRSALFDAGAGHIGNYRNCSFSVRGQGSFLPGSEANPTVGSKHQMHYEDETQISVVFEDYLEAPILQSLKENHPYEEVAHEIITLDNTYQKRGIGCYGDLPQTLSPGDFLKQLKKVFGCAVIRHSKAPEKKIRRVAVLGGSGSFAIQHALSKGADALVTSDLKYHDFFRSEGQMLLVDIGHAESEFHVCDIMLEVLRKIDAKFPTFATQSRTNPIFYFS